MNGSFLSADSIWIPKGRSSSPTTASSPRRSSTQATRSPRPTRPWWQVIRTRPNSSNWRRGYCLKEKLTAPAKLSVVKKSRHATLVEIIIHEGRKRQVRKMFEAIGHPVLHLKRTAYGKLRLHKLPPGKYRILNSQDLEKIFL